MKLAGRVAIVTGGASGIGRAIAEQLCANGAAVHVVDIRGDDAESAAKAMAHDGVDAFGHACDVANHADVQRVFGGIAAAGRVDILVNCAGVSHIGTLSDTTEADFDRVFAVNVRGAYFCMRAVIGTMQAAKYGVIINLASIAATSGLANRFAYSMSKGALLSMTYSVARDYIGDGIRCNAISPARIHTPFVDGYIAKNYPGREAEMFAKLASTQPIGRMGTPREVAELAIYLCSDEASFATGTDYLIDGGFTRLHG